MDLTEEFITLTLIRWLENNGWTILAFDFPQSGTGHPLHPTGRKGSKNLGTVTPDIVALMGPRCILVECKDRFEISDFEKVERIKKSGFYDEAISKLLKPNSAKEVRFGIGGPDISVFRSKALRRRTDVDFILAVDHEGAVRKVYDTGVFLGKK